MEKIVFATKLFGATVEAALLNMKCHTNTIQSFGILLVLEMKNGTIYGYLMLNTVHNPQEHYKEDVRK